MEREKQELRDYLEKDKKAMTDKMSAEEAERQRKEREMAVSSTHCSKLKMKGKKLSRFQFHFPELLATSPMSKQETKMNSIIGNWR
jgi:hypothetical protein